MIALQRKGLASERQPLAKAHQRGPGPGRGGVTRVRERVPFGGRGKGFHQRRGQARGGRAPLGGDARYRGGHFHEAVLLCFGQRQDRETGFRHRVAVNSGAIR